MTVYIEKPAVNLREELASLRNQGGYEEQQFYFDGLVTNGTFDVDVSGWSGSTSTGTGSISWNSGAMQLNCNGTNNRARGSQAFSTSVGRTYTLQYSSTFNHHARVGSTINGSDNLNLINQTSGSKVATFVASAAISWVTFEGFNAVGSEPNIDDVAIFETDGTDVVHRMPKGWVPLHVYEDGLLQREGAAHDYEVVYDGFDYYVKPAVAPSATTQTCVIGVRK